VLAPKSDGKFDADAQLETELDTEALADALPGNAANFDDDFIDTATDSLHRFLWKLRLDQLGEFSPLLKGMAQLDLHILKLIAERPDIILKDIADELEIPSSTLTSAINRLEKKELLRRIISQRDRRSYGLEITAKGWRIKKEHDQIDRMLSEKVLDALDSPEEAQIFFALLAKVNKRLD
jgi:DNA-binding MarR family transcriptional regulator